MKKKITIQELDRLIKKAIESNATYYDYEGYDIDFNSMIEDLRNLFLEVEIK